MDLPIDQQKRWARTAEFLYNFHEKRSSERHDFGFEVDPLIRTKDKLVANTLGWHAILHGFEAELVEKGEIADNPFVGERSYLAKYLWSRSWNYRDNTPHGAAKRLIFVLTKPNVEEKMKIRMYKDTWKQPSISGQMLVSNLVNAKLL